MGMKYSPSRTIPLLADEARKQVRVLIRSLLCLTFAIGTARAADGHSRVLVVDAQEPNAFRTVQEAVTAVPENATTPTVIKILPGIYPGPVVVPPAKKAVHFVGADPATTVITWDRSTKDPLPPGADGFNPGVHVRADDFRAEGITFQNTAGDRGQALALRVDGDRAVFLNCRMFGWQDTVLLTQGRQYFKDCTLEGRVDFIFGDGTAVFDGCRIHSRNGGYITAASTPPERAFGFVFLRCRLTGDAIPWTDPGRPASQGSWPVPNTFLGRPWRPHGSVAFIECELGDHIQPAGWNNWGKPENEQTARYAEYGNTGPGAVLAGRVPWVKKLTREEASKISVESVLAGKDQWNPTAAPD
jgi:pectinesterase